MTSKEIAFKNWKERFNTAPTGVTLSLSTLFDAAWDAALEEAVKLIDERIAYHQPALPTFTFDPRQAKVCVYFACRELEIVTEWIRQRKSGGE